MDWPGTKARPPHEPCAALSSDIQHKVNWFQCYWCLKDLQRWLRKAPSCGRWRPVVWYFNATIGRLFRHAGSLHKALNHTLEHSPRWATLNLTQHTNLQLAAQYTRFPVFPLLSSQRILTTFTIEVLWANTNN